MADSENEEDRNEQMAPPVHSDEAEVAELAARWEKAGINTTDLQLLAASRDFHASKQCDDFAQRIVRKDNNKNAVRHHEVTTKEGRANMKMFMDLTKLASDLRKSGVTHSAQRDIMLASGNLPGKQAEAEVKDSEKGVEKPPSRIAEMRRKRASG